MLVQRISDVIYSREVLIFYVDRRAHLLQGAMPFNLSRLPTAIAGFERINTFPIDLEPKITVRPTTTPADTFHLRSVVVAEINSNKSVAGASTVTPTNLVIGSSAIIFEYNLTPDGTPVERVPFRDSPSLPRAISSKGGSELHGGSVLGLTQQTVYHYNPANAFNQNNHVTYDMQKGWETSAPGAPTKSYSGDMRDLAVKLILEQGVVFIYQNYKYSKTADTALAF